MYTYVVFQNDTVIYVLESSSLSDCSKMNLFSKMAPEHIVEIANYLQPSDQLSLSLAIPSANFLRPEFDQIVVNNYNIGSKVNFRRRIFDLNVTRNVNEMKVSLLRRGELCRICDGHHIVNFKKNLFCTEEETTHEILPTQRLGVDHFSTLSGAIAMEGDRLTIDVFEDNCCEIVQAEIFIFYSERRIASAISKRVNPLNIIPTYYQRGERRDP